MFDWLRPHRIAHSILDIDPADLYAHGVRGVILDLDNTLTRWRSREIPPEHAAWVRHLQDAGLSACIVSNALTARRVQPLAAQLGIPAVTRALKPLTHGLRRGITMMGTTLPTTAIIGDQLFTDILGGNLLGLYTILVDPISSYEAITTRLVQRTLERIVGRNAKSEK